MRGSSLVVLGALMFPLAVQAGGVLELVPDRPGPYFGGECLSVDLWLHNSESVGHDLRIVQLDVSFSTPTIYAGGWFTTAGGGKTKDGRRIRVEHVQVARGVERKSIGTVGAP